MSESASSPAPKPKKKVVRLSFSSRLNLWFYKTIFASLWALHPPRPRPLRLTGRSRVLAFSSAGLGDALLDSVAFRALAETYPGIHLAAVVHHRRPQIAQHNPFLKKLYFLRKGPPGFLRLWWQLRRGGPWDAVLYLSCHDPEARCLGFLLNRHATVSLAWRTELNHLCAFNIDDPGLRRAHLAGQSLRVARETGADTKYPRMVYEVAPGDRAALDARLAELGITETPQIVFQLGGGGAGYRDWPVDHFVELGCALQAAGYGPLFILGGPDHKEKAARFAVAARERGLRFHDVVAKLALPLSAALLERAQCLVSTDTGIMHLGFALKTPTVALLHCQPGAARVGPLADLDLHRVIELPRPPGYKSPADAPMKLIKPEQVLPEVLAVLTRA